MQHATKLNSIEQVQQQSLRGRPMGRGKAYIINLNLQMSWSIKTNIIQHGGGTPLKRFHSHGQEACALFKCQKINSWKMTRRTIPPSLSLSLAVNSCAVLQVFWKFHFVSFGFSRGRGPACDETTLWWISFGNAWRFSAQLRPFWS